VPRKRPRLLAQGDVFTEELLSTYIDYKRAKEVDAIRCVRTRMNSRCTTIFRNLFTVKPSPAPAGLFAVFSTVNPVVNEFPATS